MGIIHYRGKKVYTPSSLDVTRVDSKSPFLQGYLNSVFFDATEKDLEKAGTAKGHILSAGFFDVSPLHGTHRKAYFNRNKILKGESGLNIMARTRRVHSLPLFKLEEILDFLVEAEGIGDLSALQGKGVEIYQEKMKILGLSLI